MLYRGRFWRLGLGLARVLPRELLCELARTLVGLSALVMTTRRRIVEDNLLPALDGNRAEASRRARLLFTNFGVKLADLWRYESGRVIDDLVPLTGPNTALHALKSRKNGVLLITPHVGNWEFGAVILKRAGLEVTVITQAEPQQALTRLRERSRARHGVQTIVIGENPFVFVDVIRRLEQGGIVALLMDRPVQASATEVRLFGRPFSASLAAAELARASGCSLQPVCLPRNSRGYVAEILPEIQYDRAELGNRESRARLTQQIMTEFEAPIRRHLDQWYHFVPLWDSQKSS